MQHSNDFMAVNGRNTGVQNVTGQLLLNPEQFTFIAKKKNNGILQHSMPSLITTYISELSFRSWRTLCKNGV